MHACVRVSTGVHRELSPCFTDVSLASSVRLCLPLPCFLFVAWPSKPPALVPAQQAAAQLVTQVPRPSAVPSLCRTGPPGRRCPPSPTLRLLCSRPHSGQQGLALSLPQPAPPPFLGSSLCAWPWHHPVANPCPLAHGHTSWQSWTPRTETAQGPWAAPGQPASARKNGCTPRNTGGSLGPRSGCCGLTQGRAQATVRVKVGLLVPSLVSLILQSSGLHAQGILHPVASWVF